MNDALTQAIQLPQDIITPAGVSAWPPAIGWWLLLLALILFAVGLYYGIQRYQKKWRYRKQALSLVKDCEQSWQPGLNDKAVLIELSTLLKRVAISAYPEQAVSKLYGKAWLDFLNQQTPSPLFNEHYRTFFESGLYQKESQKENRKDSDIDIKGFVANCQKWIRSHRVSRAGANAHV